MSQQLPDFNREYILVNQTDEDGFVLGERLLYVHHPSQCQGQDRACCIHRPSDHHMKSWPQLWRADSRHMERTCPHGVGHPDPDGYLADRPHTCDGCCHPPTPEVK